MNLKSNKKLKSQDQLKKAIIKNFKKIYTKICKNLIRSNKNLLFFSKILLKKYKKNVH